MNKKKRGQFTLPAQVGMDDTVNFLADKWGVDAIRDSDGTVLSDEITSMGYEVYSTLCLIRGDQEWAQEHKEDCQQKFLMSDPITANKDSLEIDILKGFNHEQFAIDEIHDVKKYWQVFDRTSGLEVSPENWNYNPETKKVSIENIDCWHSYTVNFLVYQIWETTSMYNHITNNWTSAHQLGMDPYQPATGNHILNTYLPKWLEEHPNTNVVRFTSMMYQFPIITNEKGETRWMDWSTYLDCISPKALDDFEEKYGYKLTSEDLVDKGYYCKSDIVPSEKYNDWIEFINAFVVDYAKKCVDLVHKSGKKAMLFFCDHWIGTEPFLENFKEIGFDSLVSPCINGVEIRRIVEVPGDMIKEARLYPYFFPENLMGEPLFVGDGDPKGECERYWMKIRRTILRACVDRIGFGGYLELAEKHTEFLDYVEKLSDEFREIYDFTKNIKPHSLSGKIIILNSWGKMRSWIVPEPWPNGAFYEAMAGLPIDIEFMSFDEIIENGVDKSASVIINIGDPMTAWSGGDNWKNPKLIEIIREFVYNGGGFIGINNPTACEYQGKYFQLADVMGIQREIGLSGGASKLIKPEITKNHFILADVEELEKLNDKDGILDLGHPTDGIYANNTTTQALIKNNDNILLGTNEYGKGRSVYFTNFKLSDIATRTLYRAISWCGGMEDELKKSFSSNIHTDCAYYPEIKKSVIVNNSNKKIKTNFYDNKKNMKEVTLEPNEMKWLDDQY